MPENKMTGKELTCCRLAETRDKLRLDYPCWYHTILCFSF